MENQDKALIKTTTSNLVKVQNQISLTNKVLANLPPVLIPYRKGDKWGFSNIDKEIIIPCKYYRVGLFSGNTARVESLVSGFGVIDTNGYECIKPRFKFLTDFNAGTALSYSQYKWRLINSNDEFINSESYPRAKSISNGLFAVSRETYNSKIVKWAIIDVNGNQITDFEFDHIDNYFVEGLCLVWKDNKKGFINLSGDIVIECKYNDARRFNNGYAQFDRGFLDKDGKEYHIPFSYGSIYNSEGEFASVKKDNYKWIVINKKCEPIFEIVAGYLSEFKEGVAIFKKSKYGFIDNTGKQISDDDYYEAQPFSEGLAYVGSGYINKNNIFVIPPDKLKGSWGGYNYTKYYPFSEGLALVKTFDNHYGFIDKKGNLVIKLRYNYDKVESFKNGLAAVEPETIFANNGNDSFFTTEIGFINKNGTEYWED
jgi:hypothetical protein